MAANSEQYRNNLHQLLDRHFDEKEIQALCEELQINYDYLRSDSKSWQIRELILLLAFESRLQSLVDLAAARRPNVEWPLVPDDFMLSETLSFSKGMSFPLESSPGEPTSREDSVYGDLVSGDQVGGDKIAVGDIGGSYNAIGAGARVHLRGGNLIGDDQISVDDISDSQGVAIGAGAMVHNETHHHYYGQNDEDESPKIEEAIRLDTAAPAEVFQKQPFDIAVAVRQPDLPQLAVDDLPVVVSESGAVFRSEAAEIIQYRIEVSGEDFVVKPESYTLNLRPGVDSRVCFFQVTPLQSGKKSLLINAYQENDVVAAQTRLQLAVAVKVSSEAQFLRFLVGQLEVFLHAAPPERASVVQELKDGVNLLIQMAADSPNPALLKMMGDDLAGSAQKLEADSPGIMARLERVVTAVVAMANSQI